MNMIVLKKYILLEELITHCSVIFDELGIPASSAHFDAINSTESLSAIIAEKRNMKVYKEFLNYFSNGDMLFRNISKYNPTNTIELNIILNSTIKAAINPNKDIGFAYFISKLLTDDKVRQKTRRYGATDKRLFLNYMSNVAFSTEDKNYFFEAMHISDEYRSIALHHIMDYLGNKINEKVPLEQFKQIRKALMLPSVISPIKRFNRSHANYNKIKHFIEIIGSYAQEGMSLKAVDAVAINYGDKL